MTNAADGRDASPSNYLLFCMYVEIPDADESVQIRIDLCGVVPPTKL